MATVRKAMGFGRAAAMGALVYFGWTFADVGRVCATQALLGKLAGATVAACVVSELTDTSR